MRSFVLGFAFLVAPVALNNAEATVVSYDFTGTVTGVYGSYAEQSGVSAGEAVTGNFTFDTDTPVSSSGGSWATYYEAASVSAAFSAATISSVGDPKRALQVRNDYSAAAGNWDLFNIDDYPTYSLPQPIANRFCSQIRLATDPGNEVFSDTSIPDTLDLSWFDVDWFNVYAYEFNDQGAYVSTPWEIRADITNLTLVPEPATFALAPFALLGLTFYGWRRRQNTCLEFDISSIQK